MKQTSRCLTKDGRKHRVKNTSISVYFCTQSVELQTHLLDSCAGELPSARNSPSDSRGTGHSRAMPCHAAVAFYILSVAPGRSKRRLLPTAAGEVSRRLRYLSVVVHLSFPMTQIFKPSPTLFLDLSCSGWKKTFVNNVSHSG